MDKGALILMTLSVLFCLLLIEFTVRAVTIFPVSASSYKSFHPTLGYTLDPGMDDVDDDGFRNPESDRNDYDIIAIGDSHTYGQNLVSQESWPFILSESLDMSVYNYGVGGYSVYHYLLLFEQALSRNPGTILLALYVANDVAPMVCSHIPMAGRVEIADLLEDDETCADEFKSQIPKEKKLRAYSALWSMISYYSKQAPVLDKDHYDINGSKITRGMVIGFNSFANLSNQVVTDNYEFSKKAFLYMRNRAAEENVNFGVILIPSKPVVVKKWAESVNADLPPSYVVTNLEKLRNNYLEFFRNNDIGSIDALPFVLEAYTASINGGTSIYPFGDGHPDLNGYNSYATAAEELFHRISDHQGLH